MTSRKAAAGAANPDDLSCRPRHKNLLAAETTKLSMGTAAIIRTHFTRAVFLRLNGWPFTPRVAICVIRGHADGAEI